MPSWTGSSILSVALEGLAGFWGIKPAIKVLKHRVLPSLATHFMVLLLLSFFVVVVVEVFLAFCRVYLGNQLAPGAFNPVFSGVLSHDNRREILDRSMVAGCWWKS